MANNMKRRIIKGQKGTPIQQQSDFQGLTQEDFEALQEYYRQYNLANPKLRTNFDRSMEWLDEFRRDHNFVSPETKESFDNLLRYMGYVINPIADPIGTLGNYIVNQGWVPEWARNFIPYVDLGVSLGMGRPPIHRGPKAMGKNVSSQRGQYRGTNEAWKLEAENVTGRKYRNDGYVAGSDPKKTADAMTDSSQPREVSLEEARSWQTDARNAKAQQAKQGQEQTKSQTNMTQSGRGHPTKEQSQQRANMYLSRGIGLRPGLSNTIAKKYINKYFSAVSNEYTRLNQILNKAIAANDYSIKQQTNQHLKTLKENLNTHIKEAQDMGYEVIIPDNIKSIMQP